MNWKDAQIADAPDGLTDCADAARPGERRFIRAAVVFSDGYATAAYARAAGPVPP